MDAQPISICSLCLYSSLLCRAELCWLNIISSPAQWMLTQVFVLKQYAYSNSICLLFSLFLFLSLPLLLSFPLSFLVSCCDVDLTKVCGRVTRHLHAHIHISAHRCSQDAVWCRCMGWHNCDGYVNLLVPTGSGQHVSITICANIYINKRLSVLCAQGSWGADSH